VADNQASDRKQGSDSTKGSDSIQSIFIGLRSSLARAVMGIVPPREVEDIVQETYVRVCQVKHPENIRQ
jgi:RNA polymerase sigma-70 factor (ECF subfamily)